MASSAAWVALGSLAATPPQACAALTVASLGIAFSDVVADSLVVERGRDDPSTGAALQSMCWGAAAVGGILSAYAGGALLEVRYRCIFSSDILSGFVGLWGAFKVSGIEYVTV